MLESIRTGAVDALVIAALILVSWSAVGMLIARRPITRLHFLAPITTVALPLFGLAAMITIGPTLGSAAVALTVAVTALSGPVLSTAIGHAMIIDESADQAGS
jgi:multisubunit Na+/H+ antiporter MnhG subunit